MDKESTQTKNHMDEFHKEEEEALMGGEYPTYTPPQMEDVKSETFTNEEVERIKREFQVINGAMNDLSDSAFKEIRTLQKNVKEINKAFAELNKANSSIIPLVNKEVNEIKSELRSLIVDNINDHVDKI